VKTRLTYGRVYDLFYRLLMAGKRGAFYVKPYTDSKTFRKFALDDVPYPGFGNKLVDSRGKPKTHKKNGSKVTFEEYDACNEPTDEQIAKAHYATEILGIPRKRYTGILIDAFLHKGTLYVLLGGVLERDREGNRHEMNFRMFNLDDGNLKALDINEVGPRRKVPSKKKKKRKKKSTRGKAAKTLAKARRKKKPAKKKRRSI